MLKVKTGHLKQKHVSLHRKLAQDPASPLPLQCSGAAVGLLLAFALLCLHLLLSHRAASPQDRPHPSTQCPL